MTEGEDSTGPRVETIFVGKIALNSEAFQSHLESFLIQKPKYREPRKTCNIVQIREFDRTLKLIPSRTASCRRFWKRWWKAPFSGPGFRDAPLAKKSIPWPSCCGNFWPIRSKRSWGNAIKALNPKSAKALALRGFG